MAALAIANQEIFEDRSGRHVVVSEIRPTGVSDTVVLPEGIKSVNHVRIVCDDASDTAATASSISQGDHPTGVTLTLTGGTANAKQFVVSFHYGNAAGL